MSPAGLERHHEPPFPAAVPAPRRVRIPGLALRVRIPGLALRVRVPGLALPVRVPGRRGQRGLAAMVLALGLAITAVAAVGLLSARSGRQVRDAAPAAAPVPRGPQAAAPQTAAQVVPPPVFLTIPAIGVRTRLVRLGLTGSGAIQVPPTTAVAGWYRGSPRPGAIGAAVIGGHVDSYAGPGIFFRLRLLHPGDRVYVRQADGRLAVFRVDSVDRYLKARFPASQVYGAVPTAQLRLITCGGTFDRALGSYLSNIVVFATLAA